LAVLLVYTSNSLQGFIIKYCSAS